jgi:8-amino-7-oxononanoate synthase
MAHGFMLSFNDDLRLRLDSLRHQGLYRQLRPVHSPAGVVIEVNSRSLLNFSSNDYLGLANEPALREAAKKTLDKYGTGAGASRLVCGSLVPHQELEKTLAHFKGTEAALVFSSGYAAALGALGSLLDPTDLVIVDKLAHASLIDGARLSGAKLRVFAHNDMQDLQRILQWAESRFLAPSTTTNHRVWIVTESVFSMDGDLAPLRELVALKEKYGAWLFLDEAHATGIYGTNRRGLAEHLGVQTRVEVQLGTLSKSVGAMGGFICGSRLLIDFFINRARSFIFSTAPSPPVAAAARAGLEFIQSRSGAERCRALWSRVEQFHAELESLSVPARLPPIRSAKLAADETLSAIIPWVIGDEAKAMRAAEFLLGRGIFVPAIRYPAVARKQARLRITLSAAHTPDQVSQLARALSALELEA